MILKRNQSLSLPFVLLYKGNLYCFMINLPILLLLYLLSALNLSSALVLFMNPAIYASSSPIKCKDTFLIVLTIASSTSKIIYNQIRSSNPHKFPQRSVFANSTSAWNNFNRQYMFGQSPFEILNTLLFSALPLQSFFFNLSNEMVEEWKNIGQRNV